MFERGVYTLSQATALAEIGGNTAKVRRWLYGSKAGKPAIVPFYGEDEAELVSFIDLVQIMAIRDIRRSKTHKVSLRRIRQAIDIAKRDYGIDYPLARKHTTYIFDDDIVIRLADETLVQISGKYRHEHLLSKVAEFYMEDVGFDADGLANEYCPMKYGSRAISLRPNYRLGAPVVTPCNYTVETLVNAVQSEGSEMSAARVMGVNIADVTIALSYEHRLQEAA